VLPPGAGVGYEGGLRQWGKVVMREYLMGLVRSEFIITDHSRPIALWLLKHITLSDMYLLYRLRVRQSRLVFLILA